MVYSCVSLQIVVVFDGGCLVVIGVSLGSSRCGHSLPFQCCIFGMLGVLLRCLCCGVCRGLGGFCVQLGFGICVRMCGLHRVCFGEVLGGLGGVSFGWLRLT